MSDRYEGPARPGPGLTRSSALGRALSCKPTKKYPILAVSVHQALTGAAYLRKSHDALPGGGDYK
jgi:hypothetical protein